MDGQVWAFSAGVFTFLFGLVGLIFKQEPTSAYVLAVVAGGILVIYTGKPVLKAIIDRVRPRFKHQ
jgi:hypothetical protein